MLSIKLINKIRHTEICNMTKATDGLKQVLTVKVDKKSDRMEGTNGQEKEREALQKMGGRC